MSETPTLLHFNNMGSGFEMGIFRGIASFVRNQNPPWKLRRVAQIGHLPPETVQGIIGFNPEPGDIEILRKQGCPLVFCSNRMLGMGFPCVVTDNRAIGRMAAEFFQKRFYRHFAYVGSKGFPFSAERELGFSGRLPESDPHVFYGDQTVSSRVYDENLTAFLRSLPKGTGLFASNDSLARRVCTVALAAGIAIPEDLAVLGADADELINYESLINLSSVDSEPETIGFRAAELVARMLRSPEEVPADLVLRVPPRQVLEGESTISAQTRDTAVLGVLQRLHQERDIPLNIPELARQAGCSRRALEMRFARVTGMGIAEYYRLQRLEAAKKLLRETHLLIYEVAARCGYGSVYHFSNTFRKATGRTPRAYRMRSGTG